MGHQIEAQWVEVGRIYQKARTGNDRFSDENFWVRIVSGILEYVVDEPSSMLQFYQIQTQKISMKLLPVFDGHPVVKQADLALGLRLQNKTVGDIILQINRLHPTLSLSQMSDAETMGGEGERRRY